MVTGNSRSLLIEGKPPGIGIGKRRLTNSEGNCVETDEVCLGDALARSGGWKVKVVS